jgi:hypothetical protein
LKKEKDLNKPPKPKLKEVKKMFSKLAIMQVFKEELKEIFETVKNAEGLIKLLDWLENLWHIFLKLVRRLLY